MRLRTSVSSFVFSTSVVLAFFVACSSTDIHPSPAGNGEGGVAQPYDASGRPTDGGSDSDAATTCFSQVKDGTESDVDCGGTDGCKPCELGKACTVTGDCALGADCTNKICALCGDKITNGDESDVDCGGKACGACLVGKHCSSGADCASGTCTDSACACPKDMTIVALAAGGAYCIDQSEVSKGQYNQFITASVDPNTQTDSCLTANKDFQPRGAWPPANTALTPVAFNMGLPVHYVDWCDAVAYCKWAKKTLCGTVGGGTLPPAQSSDASKSAWYNACSAQGTKAYPYGLTDFDNTRCNTGTAGAIGPEALANNRDQGFGDPANEDTGVYRVSLSDGAGNITGPDHTICLGGSVNLYQMSGNVAEWEDSCAGAAATDTCRVRGGSYDSAAGAQTCAATRDVVRMPADNSALADIGFRCCQY